MELSSLNEVRLIVLLQETNIRRDQQLFHEQFLEQNRELREAHVKKSLWDGRIEEISRIHIRYNFQEEDWSKITSKIQELHNEVNCMNDSRDFQDAESVRSGQSHVTSRPVSFPSHPIPEGMLSRSIGMPRRKEGPPSIWDTHGISGKRFCKSNGVFFSTLICKGSIRGSLMYQNTHHHMWWVKAKHQFRIRDASQDRQPKIQSSSVREDFQRNMEQTNNNCRFQIIISTNSLHQPRLLPGR